MGSKVSLLLLWFPLTFGLLFCNLLALSSISNNTKAYAYKSSAIYKAPIAASAIDGSEQVLGATIEAGDARALLLSSYLKKQESPLGEFSNYIIDRAEYYGIDYRLVPAIAMCESGGGKRIPSKDSYNAWGVAVYTGQIHGKKFANWMFAIDWVSKYIKEKYHDIGLTELVDMGAKWAPPSVENGNSWANCVEFFMEEML
jgi:hypothetical protein